MDNGYVIGGYTSNWSESGYSLLGDLLVIKTDASGNELWVNTYDKEGKDMPNCVIQTSDGGYAICGVTGYTDYDGDIWLLKIDQYGNKEWEETYDMSRYDEAFSVISTEDGGYAVVGETYYGGLFIKTNSTGDVQWSQEYWWSTIGDIKSVTETNDGGYAIAGEVNSGSDGLDICFAKTDERGNIEWIDRSDADWPSNFRIPACSLSTSTH